MIILLRIFYILFFGCADFIVYSLLHKKGWVSKQLVFCYCFLFVAMEILHSGLFKIDFLMTGEAFRSCTLSIIAIVVMHYFGIWRSKRMFKNPGNRASEEIKDMFRRYWVFGTTVVPYFVVFLIQCLTAISWR